MCCLWTTKLRILDFAQTHKNRRCFHADIMGCNSETVYDQTKSFNSAAWGWTEVLNYKNKSYLQGKKNICFSSCKENNTFRILTFTKAQFLKININSVSISFLDVVLSFTPVPAACCPFWPLQLTHFLKDTEDQTWKYL